jgi:hypothetical protein
LRFICAAGNFNLQKGKEIRRAIFDFYLITIALNRT